MSILGPNLRAASRRLGLSDAEVARRVGLSERQYNFYATGSRSPKLETLLKIAKALGSSPNELLGWNGAEVGRSRQSPLQDRLIAACCSLSQSEFELVVTQIEALAARHKRPKKRK